jgi:hypothetical protein
MAVDDQRVLNELFGAMRFGGALGVSTRAVTTASIDGRKGNGDRGRSRAEFDDQNTRARGCTRPSDPAPHHARTNA